ncbi:MAG: molybdopterin-dependent oxidoreductase [Firmicutes bacterium]|nr:molybdopterin-dependent oxidoreductase [Bacillota bacterium]
MTAPEPARSGSASEEKTDHTWIPTTCYMCYNACHVLVHRVNGVVVKIEGNPASPHNFGAVCAKGNAGIMSLYNPYRIRTPLKRTNPRKGIGVDPGWVEITWEEAMELTADAFRKVKDKDPRGLLISAWDAHLMSTFGEAFATAFGTPNTTAGPAGVFCGNGLHSVLWLHHGAWYCESDVDNCEYLLLFGSQQGVPIHLNALGITRKMAQRRRQGLKVVAIDPMCSYAASKANRWVPIRPGTDAALALGLVNQLLNELGIYDARFIKHQTNGPYLITAAGNYARDPESGKPLVWDPAAGAARTFDTLVGDVALEGTFEVHGTPCKPAFSLLREHVRAYTPERVEEITTIPAEQVRVIAREYGAAARVGSTITIDGVELPFRPAHADWSRGAIAHKHALHTGLAIQLLNTIIGAVNVPGGHLGVSAAGPTWKPESGPDGMLVPTSGLNSAHSLLPYPPRKVRAPQTAELVEIFPVAVYARSIVPEVLLHGEKYRVPYEIGAMLHWRNNYMQQTSNPAQMAEAFSRIGFIASIAFTIDASVEMADVVFPDTHFLERTDAMPNAPRSWVMANASDWYYAVRQPVVDPPPGVRHWPEVISELAGRLGILDRYNQALNTLLQLKEPHQLEKDRRYSVEEVSDRRFKSKLGGELGLTHFKEAGLHTIPKKPEEVFPMPFTDGKLHLYYEFFKRAGEDVARVAETVGFEWDTSDYDPLPDWKPCPDFNLRDGYDLWVINYKVPYHAHSYTYENPWLGDLTDRIPGARDILINPWTARNKGLGDGDEVTLETPQGYRVHGRLSTTEGIHPEVLAVMGSQGHWAAGQPVAKGKGINFNTLIHQDVRRVDTLSGALDSCVKVRVAKVGR